MPIGFPATESGVEIRILKHLFTPEEAEVALALSALPETVDRIHPRLKHTGISIEDMGKTLDRMVHKGSILGGRLLRAKTGEKRYSKAMLAIGMYEFQVDRLTKEFQSDVSQYMEEGFAKAFHSKRTSQLRTIPINETVTLERRVSTFDNVRELINQTDGPFAALNCICRQGMDLVGQPCQQTEIRRTCLTLKGMAQASIDGGVGQALTQEDTLKMLDRAEQAGMVLQPENAQDPLFICFCCGCCCGVLTSAKLFPKPAEYFHSNYIAEVDPEICTGCETCADRCQMEAISLTNGYSRVDLDRCIGCGLCVSTCPSDAVTLGKKDKETVPPKTHNLLYQQITKERFGLLGTLKIVGKNILGMKI
jgi:ferredoxin